jgi:hypothetical protein
VFAAAVQRQPDRPARLHVVGQVVDERRDVYRPARPREVRLRPLILAERVQLADEELAAGRED